MQNSRTKAGETAPRTLVIIRDCHSKNNIVVMANSDREEERVRLRAMSKGFLVTVRKPKQPGCETRCTTMPDKRTWIKPAAIIERPRPKLAGAFNLSLTPLPKEGGEA
jgi:hypothetical protein